MLSWMLMNVIRAGVGTNNATFVPIVLISENREYFSTYDRKFWVFFYKTDLIGALKPVGICSIIVCYMISSPTLCSDCETTV